MRELIREFIRSNNLLDQERLEEVFRLEEESGQTFERIMLHKGYMSENDLLRTLAHALELPYLPSLSDRLVPDDFVSNVPVGFARNYALVGDRPGERRRCRWRPPPRSTPTRWTTSPRCSAARSSPSSRRAPRSRRSSTAPTRTRPGHRRRDDRRGSRRTTSSEAAAIDDRRTSSTIANKAPIIKLVNMILFQALEDARERHPPPALRGPAPGALPDRRRPLRHGGAAEEGPGRDHLPHQGHGEAWTSPSAACRRTAAPRSRSATARSTSASRRCRRTTASASCCASSTRAPASTRSRRSASTADNLRKVEHYIHYQHGIILVTGPTGSGKTTTLYAALPKVNSTQKNVITIEDPIEYHLAGISQIQVNDKKGLTFASGLRSLLRQDPDIMMVGEIRDVETARIAIQAALTGHLVFSTLHTNDAASTITRLVDIGIEPYLVASSVICVIAQRLVRLICPDCREEYGAHGRRAARPEGHRPLDLRHSRTASSTTGAAARAASTPATSTGPGSTRSCRWTTILKDQIVDRKSASVIKRTAIERGCRTLRMDGAQKVIHGMTTPAEVLRVTQLDAF